ncbi:hypothetical protein GCM10023231_33420 [Olivibacter ginsenosidimutans]|uniref:Methane oxygenase PmoA n=2 Tax=Olivibacter ginsenosidimutans TaxID=1176537 RepID=A0ABP9C0I6_9SPHI
MLTFNGVFAQQVRKENGVLKLIDKQGHYLLGYQYEEVYPPAGVDSAFRRSGFIHPLNTLSGRTLTRIQAPDHYHHFGLWNPWTRVQYKGKVYDLWNLGDKQGTVRFVKFNRIKDSGKTIGFSVKQAHMIFPELGKEQQLIDEDWEVNITPIDDKRYECTINSTLSVVGDDTVTLKEYRYGGLGFRATGQWTDKNSTLLTSSGKDRKDADGSLERWAIVSGMTDNANAGILFLSYPNNFNHPEPIRVWPPGTNGKGDVFFNFSPTKNKDWVLLPHKQYTLHYRLIVFDGALTASEAEKYWKEFAKSSP